MSELQKEIEAFDTLMTRFSTFDEQDVALLSRLGLSSPNLELWVDTSLGGFASKVVFRTDL